jgi:C4-dicarboxylate-specific signal transduction histidine kinase
VAAQSENGKVRVWVRDHGPGLSPAVLTRLFDPFFTTKPAGQGTGLGLAVCHGIVASFGGRLTAASAPGGGAVFELELDAA